MILFVFAGLKWNLKYNLIAHSEGGLWPCLLTCHQVTTGSKGSIVLYKSEQLLHHVNETHILRDFLTHRDQQSSL